MSYLLPKPIIYT